MNRPDGAQIPTLDEFMAEEAARTSRLEAHRRSSQGPKFYCAVCEQRRTPDPNQLCSHCEREHG